MNVTIPTIVAELDVSQVLTAGVILLGLGLLFAIVLTVAYAHLKVKQDPRVEAVEKVLPGANCGGCGLAGCSAYAKAVVENHSLLGKCGPGGDGLVKQIASLLGIEASTSAPVRAVVHCSAHSVDRINTNVYYGVETCGEAQTVSGVMGCSYGCFGLGDCEESCPFGAIRVIDGLATVDYWKCVGCGACVAACPRGLIELVGLQEDPLLVIGCASRDKAKDVRGYCKVGCVGCGLCAKMAPAMFGMKQNLAVIDYEKYGSKEERLKATEKCPRSLMVYVGTKERAQQEITQVETAGA